MFCNFHANSQGNPVKKIRVGFATSPPVCVRTATGEPLDGFSQNFVLGSFQEICFTHSNLKNKSNNSNGHFARRPTRISVRSSINIYHEGKLLYIVQKYKAQILYVTQFSH